VLTLTLGFTHTLPAHPPACLPGRSNGELQQTIIQLEASAVGLVRMHSNVMVGCMNSVIHNYTHTGEGEREGRLREGAVDMANLGVMVIARA
jgi:hypothetical protein